MRILCVLCRGVGVRLRGILILRVRILFPPLFSHFIYVTHSFSITGHLRSHNEQRPFKCKWPGCDKGFARQHDCKRHEQLHLNIRPYVCQGCDKTFARMDALNRHCEFSLHLKL